jgi:Asp-tRNA(Asn)/Glu-tRNA(Gln) amidotransferase A subunit family amidase
MLAWVKTPRWEQVTDDTREAFAELARALGDRVEEVELLGPAADALGAAALVADAELALNLEREWAAGRSRLSAALRERLERGRAVGAVEYIGALARVAPLVESLDELFAQRYDAILTPAASGTAPEGLGSTGDPGFCILWTFCGMPAISVPLMVGANGLPLGVQLVGPRHGDARLLRTARWLVARVATGSCP